MPTPFEILNAPLAFDGPVIVCTEPPLVTCKNVAPSVVKLPVAAVVAPTVPLCGPLNALVIIPVLGLNVSLLEATNIVVIAPLTELVNVMYLAALVVVSSVTLTPACAHCTPVAVVCKKYPLVPAEPPAYRAPARCKPDAIRAPPSTRREPTPNVALAAVVE